MAQPPDYNPVYSHGGLSVDSWPAVAGTIMGPGRPLMTYGAIVCSGMSICCAGGTATVVVECNGGTLDVDGNPPASEWMTFATYTMSGGDREAPALPYTHPIYRTNITAISGATVTSSISHIISQGFRVHPAKYPTIEKGAVR